MEYFKIYILKIINKYLKITTVFKFCILITLRLPHPVTEILLQPGGSEATRLAPSKPGGRRSVHGS